MAAEKGIVRGKINGAAVAAHRDLRLPWPLLAGQLGGKLQVHGREWTEFQITFPQERAKQGGAST